MYVRVNDNEKLKEVNLDIREGSEYDLTDRQTDRQTGRQTDMVLWLYADDRWCGIKVEPFHQRLYFSTKSPLYGLF